MTHQNMLLEEITPSGSLATIHLQQRRMRKMQQTIEAYEASLHTDLVDRMRCRIDVLERAMDDMLAVLGVPAIGAGDSVAVLTKKGLREYRAREILLMMWHKFSP